MIRLLRLLCVAWILPVIFSTVAYYGFVTNYTHHVFTNATFDRQYDHGVYKYRILGREIQKRIDRMLDRHHFGFHAPKVMRAIEKDFSANFYIAYFLNNTFFFCLTCTMLFLLFEKIGGGSEAFTDLMVTMISLVLALSQFVVAPYDMLSYFLTVSGFYLILLPQSKKRLFLLCAVVVLGALTRETITMVPAFYLTLHWREILRLRAPHDAKWELLAMGGCFLAVYSGLRWGMGAEEHTFFQTRNLGANFTKTLPLVGVAFIYASTILLLLEQHGRGAIGLFLLATLPYTLSIFYNSFLWEIRLWIPVLLGMMVLKAMAVLQSKDAG